MAREIGEWLESLALGKYAEAFAENEVGFDVLSELSEDDLREIGLPMGPRKQLMRAIRELTGGDGESGEAAVASASEPAGADDVPEPEALIPGAERRQLTVMFCDLVGSTELASRFDPEDLGEIIGKFRDACARVITQFDGYIAKYMGDGILVYFGYPQALERDAERAARSGLGIVEAIAELNEELRGQEGPELAVRIGIDTGPVVVGEVIGEDYSEELSVVGETPNIAARLQGLAQPNQVILGPLTRELVGRDLDCEDLGPHQLKGIAKPVQAWRVVAEREPELEDVALAVGIPLVGRDEEIGLLLRSWEQVREGRGQAVLINGEPGIGKSALVEAVSAKVREAGFNRVAMRCSPYHTNSALYSTIEHLKRFSGWQPEDTSETRLDKLEDAFRPYALPLEEVVPLFAALLSLPVPEGRYPTLELTPQQQKQQTLDALVAWTLEAAEQQAFFQVWEDLHWADATTVELLGLLLDQVPTASLLLALTYRPDFVPPWPTRSHMTPITLSRLERTQAEAMVRALAGDTALPAEVLDHIIAKTDGVPLFVEELTKMLLESDLLRQEGESYVLTGPLTDLAIPATLQESLLARLDRLPTVREVAQLGAVLGREFAYETLKALGAMDDEALQDGLGRLVDAELLYQRGRPPRSKYIFKHALVQDAAYQSLLRRTRQRYHLQVAELLEVSFPETVKNTPELVAHHFTEAGSNEQAVDYWHKAGEQALRRSANLEAIGHFNKGLEVITALPETAERDRRELRLHAELGPPLMAVRGYGAPEVIETYGRARELCQQVGGTTELFPVMFGLCIFYLGGGDPSQGQELSDQLLVIAEESEDPALIIEAHVMHGLMRFVFGEFLSSRDHFEAVIELYDREQHAELALRYGGFDPGTLALAYMAWVQWMLGYPDAAQNRADEAQALAQAVAHSYTRARALYWDSISGQFRRDWSVVKEQAEAAIEMASEQNFALIFAGATIMRGWALANQGLSSEGMHQIREGLEALGATGSEYQLPHLLASQAETARNLGHPEEGLGILDEALAQVERTGERYYEAELYRLKGELVLADTPAAVDAAEECFQCALVIARGQSAKSFELRAATSLARLWHSLGKTTEARDLLSPVYGWFTEGFDTPDLQDAKALLDELS